MHPNTMTKYAALMVEFSRALARLQEVVVMPKTDIVRDSAIQRFEFTLDVAWKTVKAFLEEQKGIVCTSPKDCFREAYRQGIIEYDDAWMTFVDMRNETAHLYKEAKADYVYSQLPTVVQHLVVLHSALGKPPQKVAA